MCALPEPSHFAVLQTDSLFAHFPNASVEDAIAAGNRAGELVSESLPDPLDLKFERVCWPFMMLHVNRWADCAPEACCICVSMLARRQ